jgi:hypothetical protein
MITHNGKEEPQRFYVADLGTDQVILGFLWLREWNPKINWLTKKLEGGAVSAKTMKIPKWAKIGLLSFQAQRVARDHYLQDGDIVYIQVNKVNIVQQWAIEVAKNKQLMKVPEEYRDYEDIFSEERARQLPPMQGEFDHQIKFKEGAPDTIRCKVYPMNHTKTKFT